ncbi:10774_t:CDS:2 [Racocetra persica]|uniref:10774_t:CDS:1 n=1 Tax=Racocetra persica TaxID=160502 RepID=A0ACA9KZU8_9GLOM|nr:10774_t:CDS:2 [Racocetra persica]
MNKTTDVVTDNAMDIAMDNATDELTDVAMDVASDVATDVASDVVTDIASDTFKELALTVDEFLLSIHNKIIVLVKDNTLLSTDYSVAFKILRETGAGTQLADVQDFIKFKAECLKLATKNIDMGIYITIMQAKQKTKIFSKKRYSKSPPPQEPLPLQAPLPPQVSLPPQAPLLPQAPLPPQDLYHYNHLCCPSTISSIITNITTK